MTNIIPKSEIYQRCPCRIVYILVYICSIINHNKHPKTMEAKFKELIEKAYNSLEKDVKNESQYGYLCDCELQTTQTIDVGGGATLTAHVSCEATTAMAGDSDDLRKPYCWYLQLTIESTKEVYTLDDSDFTELLNSKFEGQW